MLGSAVYGVLKDRFHLVLIYRDEDKLQLLDKAYGSVKKHTKVCLDFSDLYQDYVKGFPTQTTGPIAKAFFEQVGEVDGFINCAGITNRYSTKDPTSTFFINGALPHILSRRYGKKMIHITTDCVFDGLQGAPYDENSPHNPNDLYGLSKSLGEPQNSSLVLRTSIIGPEITGYVSLIEWFKKQDGKTIQGFTNHFWNGVTTTQFGKICDEIFSNRHAYPANGLFHIFANSVSKYDMLMQFKEKYKLDVTIEPAEPSPVDRRMSSVKDLCAKLKIPSFHDMLNDLPKLE